MSTQYPPRVGTSGVGVYPLTMYELSEVMSDLWNETLLETIFQINQNPMDNVMAIRWYYGINNLIPRTSTATYITLGNVVLDGTISESSVVTRPASSEFVSVQVVNINEDRVNNNFLDFSPYSEYDLFLPYYGYFKLDSSDIISGGKIRVTAHYTINLVTGVAAIEVSSYTGIIAKLQCTVGMEIPVNIQSTESLGLRSATNLGRTVVGLSAAAATGGVAALPIVGATAASFNNPINQSNTRSTGLDGESGSMAGLVGYLRASIAKSTLSNSDMKEYKNTMGVPCDPIPGQDNFISQQSYFKVLNISPKRIGGTIPIQAMREIERLLKEGVYGNDKTVLV